ncbi:MAG: hypothetical protein ACP5QK_02105 [Myxococcota bacterium]
MHLHIYTTNPYESVNSIPETLRIENGGRFESRRSVEISIYIVRDRLKGTNQKMFPNPTTDI